jgi:hypothetical protein
MMKRAYGEQHPDVAESLYVYGLLRLSQQQDAQAEALFRQALAIQTATLPEDHPNMANPRYEIGLLLLKRKAYDEAEAMLLKAHAVHLKAFGPDGAVTKNDARALARLYAETNRPEQAEQYRRLGGAN